MIKVLRRIIVGANLLWQLDGFWTMVLTLMVAMPPFYGFVICYDLGRMWELKWRDIDDKSRAV